MSNNNKITSNEGILKCENCENLNKAMDLLKTFSWTAGGNHYSALAFDRETKTILVDEESLMRAIQLANPHQALRKIRLITREEHKKLKRGEAIKDIPSKC